MRDMLRDTVGDYSESPVYVLWDLRKCARGLLVDTTTAF